MARIYLVRHAESVANTRGIYQGQTYDTPLSPLGRLQAQALADYFLNHHLDHLVVSPLLRTRQTAGKVGVTQKLPLNLDSRIIETNHGRWEGISKFEIQNRWPDVISVWNTRPSQAVFPDGESFIQTQARVLSWWQEIVNLPGDTLVITHDNIIRIILAHLDRMDLDRIWDFDLHPASVTIVENNRTLTLNDTSHLDGLLANLDQHAL